MDEATRKKLQRIHRIEKKAHNTIAELKEQFPDKTIIVCDFYVAGCEAGEKKPYGIIYNGITMIDHHAPIPEMNGNISSGILASRYLEDHEPVSDGIIVINHLDCDSIISSFLMAGIIAPSQKFSDAVVAADHTGEENAIADLLQSIQYDFDLEKIAEELLAFLEKNHLSPEAKDLIRKKNDERKLIKRMIAEGNVKTIGNVVAIIADHEVDPTIAISMMPEAKVIMAAYPREEDEKWNVRLRLGEAAEGIELNTLDLPSFGGRWNAGSTRRTGGTDLPPEMYASVINEKINEKINKIKTDTA